MRITTKILITTLPLVVLGLVVLGWMTTSLSELALNQLAEKWLNAKLLEAVQIAEKNFTLLTRYGLQDTPANVKKAQDATAESMRAFHFSQSGCLLVVNASGSIVSSSCQCKIGTNVSSELWFKTLENKKKGYDSLIYKGTKYLTARQYFAPWQWYVLACAQQHEVYGEVDYMRQYVFAAAGLSAAVITLILVFMIHRITAPIHMLVREVERIGKGDLRANISIASNDEIGILAGAFNSTAVQLSELIDSLEQQIAQRKRAEAKLSEYHEHLEDLVRERTMELETANKELEGFTYSVSHDLRAPLRHIDGFIKLLQAKVEAVLDEQSRHYMDNISDAAQKMGRLIDGLLSFARMGHHAMSVQPVALGPLVQDIIRELEPDTAGRNIDWRIGGLPVVSGDEAMLRLVLVNLISNALKYTRCRRQARIEIGSQPGQDSETVMFVRDNGAGFDMAYADKLFGMFQRLHHSDEFEGTGIGLANVHRIMTRQGGRTWATGELHHGATFYFALPRAVQVQKDGFN